MKKLAFSFTLMILVSLTYQSCDLVDGFDKDDKDCDFVYPITLVMPSDELVTVNNEDELDTAFENWEANNANSTEKPTFQYPLQMTNSDGETTTINNDDELKKAFEDCEKHDKDECKNDDKDYDDWDKKDCFDFVYPVSMTMPDGATVTGADEDALDTAIKNWYIANPNSTAEPTFNFPIQIEYEDGTIKTINDNTALEVAYDDCK
jgi:hypothetical protein